MNAKGKQIKSVSSIFVSKQIKVILDVELVDPYAG
jgi:hypothetical protein